MATATVDVGDIVRVVNKSLDDRGMPRTVVFGWNNRRYELKPGGESFVPFEAIAQIAGDPRAAGNVRSFTDERGLTSWIPDRESEVRRLRILHAAPVGDIHVDRPSLPEHPANPHNNSVPRLEVYTLEGERVWTVLDDPQGEKVMQAQTTIAQRDELLAIIEKQQRQLQFLLDRAAAEAAAAAPPTETNVEDEEEEDEPAAKTDDEENEEASIPHDE